MVLVDVGATHTCAIDDAGKTWCWGNADRGRLGLSDATSSTKPTEALDGTWSGVSAGGVHSCGVRSDGTFWCWGADGTLGGDEPAPIEVPLPATITEFAVGGRHACAVLADETLACWGAGTAGQIDPRVVSEQSPVLVGESGWTQIATGDETTCAIKNDTTLWCWGAPLDGNRTTGAPIPPTQIAGTGWSSVALSFHTACGIKTDHTLWCWGVGVLGDGKFTTTPVAQPIQIPGTKWRSVSAGGMHLMDMNGEDSRTCATTTDGQLWCWGEFYISGQQAGVKLQPTRISNTWLAVSAGHDICGIRADRTLWCDDLVTQVPGSDWASIAVSQRQLGWQSGFDSIVPDGAFTCATKLDGTLWCWPRNGPPLEDNGTPVQVPGTWSRVSSHNAACASKPDGSLWCWGRNGYGQLGNGMAWQQRPVRVEL